MTLVLNHVDAAFDKVEANFGDLSSLEC